MIFVVAVVALPMNLAAFAVTSQDDMPNKTSRGQRETTVGICLTVSYSCRSVSVGHEGAPTSDRSCDLSAGCVKNHLKAT